MCGIICWIQVDIVAVVFSNLTVILTMVKECVIVAEDKLGNYKKVEYKKVIESIQKCVLLLCILDCKKIEAF